MWQKGSPWSGKFAVKEHGSTSTGHDHFNDTALNDSEQVIVPTERIEKRRVKKSAFLLKIAFFSVCFSSRGHTMAMTGIKRKRSSEQELLSFNSHCFASSFPCPHHPLQMYTSLSFFFSTLCVGLFYNFSSVVDSSDDWCWFPVNLVCKVSGEKAEANCHQEKTKVNIIIYMKAMTGANWVESLSRETKTERLLVPCHLHLKSKPLQGRQVRTKIQRKSHF